MPAKIEMLFPTYLYRAQKSNARAWNLEFAREITALEKIDDHGRKWSRDHYEGGYSSYSSLCNLQHTSPNFAALEKFLQPHVQKFARRLQWDLQGRTLKMTTCWVNRMGSGTYHTMHIHPSSVLSGVYYVATPPGSSPLKLEDPRLGLLMAAPPRRAQASLNMQNYIELEARAGGFLLFESWMRHEVPPHRGKGDRVSISFNYEWV